jgi:hypothetical protein
MTDGDQVPVMPFVEMVGNSGATEPEQMGAMGLKVGITIRLDCGPPIEFFYKCCRVDLENHKKRNRNKVNFFHKKSV